METPLLALSDNDRPSLSSGWVPTEDDEEDAANNMYSDFSRLIEQRANPLQQQLLSQRIWDYDENDIGRTLAAPQPFDQPLLVGNDEMEDSIMISQQQQQRGPWWVVLTGTCSILYLGCIWSAYQSSNVWLVTTVSFRAPILPDQTSSFDWTLQTSNLADLLQAFSLFPTGLVLWIVSLIFPCLFMVLVPTVILREINALPAPSTDKCHELVLNILSYMRWALLSWYVVVLLSIVLSRFELSWTDSSIHVHTDLQAQGALAYGGGMAAALITLVVLRWPRHLSYLSSTRQKRQLQRQQSQREQLIEEPWRLVDPPTIDQQRQQPTPVLSSEPPVMTALEEDPIVPLSAAERQQPRPTQGNAPSRRRHSFSSSSSSSLAPRNIFVFQLGLVSWVLWLPSMGIPILQWRYGGMLSDLNDGEEHKEHTSYHVTLWQLPHTLWTTQRETQTVLWIQIAFWLLLIITAYVVPFATNLLAAGVWTLPKRYSCASRAWLYAAQPASASLVLCLALLATVPALPSYWNHLLRQNERMPSWWCPMGKCLSLQIKFQPGIWFFLIQSLVQEVFVMLTLQWNS